MTRHPWDKERKPLPQDTNPIYLWLLAAVACFFVGAGALGLFIYLLFILFS